MEIEASATKTIEGKGKLIITGIIEEEEISSINKKITRKSTVRSSIENVLTVLKNIFGINCDDYDIHVNFPGGMPVDGPSAGISMVTAVYSAIMGIPVDNKVAMTGEISLHGMVKPVGGVNAKISAAKKAGANTIIIPKENWQDRFKDEKDVKIIPVRYIKDVIDAALLKEIKKEEKEGAVIEVNPKIDVLTAESVMN